MHKNIDEIFNEEERLEAIIANIEDVIKLKKASIERLERELIDRKYQLEQIRATH